ncbi:MAG: signal peptidase I [Bacilli bacterium]|jgi:signal peptidase
MAKRIISGIGSSFLVLIFLTLIILHFSGYRYYVPESSSMHPAVPKFSLVYVKKTEKLEDLEIGDVIAFQGSEKPVLHRIIKIDGEMIQTQGDANNVPDAPIYLNQVIGKMVFSIPYLGILFGSAYPWLILLSLIIILYLARQLIKDIKKK